jgi:N-acetylglucosamine malate deacetylase 1
MTAQQSQERKKTDKYDVLIVSAHPDDAELAMGGTMLLLARAGYKIFHLCLTRGEMGTYGDSEIRAQEFASASEMIGCDGEQLDFPDTEVENDAASRKRIARIIRELKPDIVFAPYHSHPGGDEDWISHRDHYTTGSLVRESVKLARLQKTIPDLERHEIKKLFFYMVPRTVHTNLLVDVSSVIDDTEILAEKFETQMAINRRGTGVKQIVRARRAAIGQYIHVAYAEGFVTDVPLELEVGQFFDL